MEPLWKIRSGKFAGGRSSNILYNSNGNNIGYFHSNIAYSLSGKYIGEIYRNDWIGKRVNATYPTSGSRAGYAGVAITRYVDRVGIAIAGWEDPDF